MRLIDYVHQGGTIMYILVLLNIIGMTIILWKIFSLYSSKKNVLKIADEISNRFKNKIESKSLGEELQHTLAKEEVVFEINQLETGLNTVKIIASIAPLLGLLGTVTGILGAFDVISKNGLSDPSLFAGGISMALITTVGGLIVAIPHFIGHNYLVRALDKLEVRLENLVISKVF